MYCPGSVAGCRTPESASAPDSRGNLLLTSAICNSMETEGLKPCTAALSSAGSSVKSCNMRKDRTSVYTATCCPGCNCLSRYFNISIRAWAWSWTGVFSASSSRIARAPDGIRYSGRLVMTFGGRFARRLLSARHLCRLLKQNHRHFLRLTILEHREILRAQARYHFSILVRHHCVGKDKAH